MKNPIWFSISIRENMPIKSAMMASFLNCLMFIMVPHGLTAHNQSLDSGRAESGFVLNQVYLLEDELSQLSIDKIVANSLQDKFQPVDNSSMNRIALGISSSTWWVRLHMDGNELPPMNHYLTIDFSLLDEVEVYVPNETGSFSVQRAGIAFGDKPLGWRTRASTFRLTNLPISPIIYLKVKSQSPILLPIRVQTESAYFSSEVANNLLFGVFFGVILLVICYNLILAIITKESIYFYYLIYVLFLGLTVLNYFGFSYQYIWSRNIEWIDKVMPCTILFTAFTMTNFIRHFLNTKEILPAIDKFFLLLIGIFCLLFLSLPFLPTSLLYLFMAPASSIMMLLVVITIIKSHYKKFAPATYILIGWLFLFAGIFSLIGKTFGLIPHNQFTSFAILIGLVIEVIMFTIGIGYRFRWLKNEAQRMTEELKLKYSEIESLREKIATNIMDSSSKTSQLPVTISKADINSYLLNELSERELEVLYRVAEGLANKEIGEQLFISTNTVRAHMRNIYDKLHVKNRTEAVFKANQLQLIKA